MLERYKLQWLWGLDVGWKRMNEQGLFFGWTPILHTKHVGIVFVSSKNCIASPLISCVPSTPMDSTNQEKKVLLKKKEIPESSKK